MASFPSSVKSFPTIVDLADSVLAAHQNERGDEITAIETWLLGGWLGTTRTIIDGMKLIWNSTTSISVGVGACFAENGDFINATSALTASSLSLSASTWYHVYVYLSGGSPAVEVVTTAPVAWKGTAYSKTGATTRRYVGSIKSNGSGNVYKFVHHAQQDLMLYIDLDSTSSPFRVLSGGTAATATAVNCSGVVPITSTLAFMRASSVGDQNCYTGGTSSTSSSINHWILSGSTPQRQASLHPLNSSQNMYYLFASAPSGGLGLTLDVLGYVVER